MNQLNHITLAPARLVDRKVGYFILPTFSYSFAPVTSTVDSTAGTVDTTTLTVDRNTASGNDYSWAGASVIVAQFNFSSTKNFVLEDLPEAPEDANFCLCIKYRVGNTVYRYKLWEGVGEVLQAPLYNGEVILKNFVLEIWTVKNVNVANSSFELKLRSSILTYQSTNETDNDEATEYEDAIGVELTNLLNEQETYDVSSVAYWYKFEARYLNQNDLGYVTGLHSYLPSTAITGTFSGTSQLTSVGELARYTFPRFGNGYLYGCNFDGSINTLPRCLISVCADTYAGATASDAFINVGNVVVSIDSSDKLIVTVNGVTIATLTAFSTRGWLVIDIAQDLTGTTIGDVTVSFVTFFGDSLGAATVTLNATISATASLAIASANPLGSIYIGDVVIFTSAPADATSVYDELTRLYGYMPIPTDFNGAWLDNV